MAQLRIKRSTGSSAPSSSALANAELAYTEGDDILYYGTGTSGNTAASVIKIFTSWYPGDNVIIPLVFKPWTDIFGCSERRYNFWYSPRFCFFNSNWTRVLTLLVWL